MVKSNLSATAASWTPTFGITSPTEVSHTSTHNTEDTLEHKVEAMTVSSPSPEVETVVSPISTASDAIDIVPSNISTNTNISGSNNRNTAVTTDAKAAGSATHPPAAAAPFETKSSISAAISVTPSVWGRKPSDAIKKPPTAEMIHLNPKHSIHSGAGSNSQKTKQGSRSNPMHRESGKRNDSIRGNKNPKENSSRDDNHQKDGWKRGRLLPLPLLQPGEGSTERNKGFPRFSFADLLAMRLAYTSPPLHWESDSLQRPPQECIWCDETRVQQITAIANLERSMTDPSERQKKKSNTKDTAPPIDECKPLEINHDTRWKAHVFNKDQQDIEKDSDETVLKKALLILNKLSLTKFEKLSDAFIETGVGRNENCLTGAIQLIVKKAQDEPHFSAMYAALCLKLSRTPVDFEEPGKNKKFKKMLLTECQKEFEEEMETKISKAIEGIEDEEERDIKTALVKKLYLGHMRFIGELYKGDLISAKIMIVLLPQLLEGRNNQGKIDEEKVECFAKLMTVIGQIIERQGEAMNEIGKSDVKNKLRECWNKVEIMAGKAEGLLSVSSRIKFMLLDLLEMRENGWTSRREEESAKTIAQIHKDAAKDIPTSRKSISSGSSRKHVMKPIVDEDGFTVIVGGNGSKSSSLSSKFDGEVVSTVKASDNSSLVRSKDANINSKPVTNTQTMTPKDYLLKSKNLFKEFFVGGDEDDAVLSIQEIIGADLSVERGAKAFEGGVLLVLEMRTEEVMKFINIMSRCFNEKIISEESIVLGVIAPLEFLSDVAIDAPLAVPHMVDIVAAFIHNGAFRFNFLLESPECFRTECNAASFGCQVLKVLGDSFATDSSNLDVIRKLMTAEERAKFNSAQEFLASWK